MAALRAREGNSKTWFCREVGVQSSAAPFKMAGAAGKTPVHYIRVDICEAT